MRLAIVFGTRPELIKMAPLILEGRRRGINLHTISTGQHREMLVSILDWFEIKPDYDLNVMRPNQTLAELSANVLSGFDELLRKEHYDCIIVQGDTTTALMIALTSFYHKIKIAHVEAGLRTFNKYSPWPEEINRKLLSVVADYHFAPTADSQSNLKHENITANVWITGNTVIDALDFTVKKVANKRVYPQQLMDFFYGAKSDVPVILITGHRRENWGLGFKSICEAVVKLAQQNPLFVFIYPVHLNPNVKNDVYHSLGNIANVILVPPLNYPEFVALMNRSYLILTDSGGVQEEAPSLGKPVLVMRDTTERPEGIASGGVKLIGTNSEDIVTQTQLLIDDKTFYDRMAKVKNPFGSGNSAAKILDILQSVE